MRLLGGLNILGAVGLRNGALGIPLRGAVKSEGSQEEGEKRRIFESKVVQSAH